MKKVFDHNSDKNHYHADACIVWCFDDRFSNALKSFVDNSKINNFDLVKIAGGAKTLAICNDCPEKNFVLNQILISINLHNAKKVVLMNHSDCGAYGGLKTFEDDEEKERQTHIVELKNAANFLKDSLPKDISIETVFVNFDGGYNLSL